VALFGYKYSNNPLEQRSFEELDYIDQWNLINDKNIHQPYVKPIQDKVINTFKQTKMILLLAGAGYVYYKFKGGK